MKTSKIFSALLVSSLLGFTACTPRDVKVMNDAERLKIKVKKGTKAPAVKPSEFALTTYSLFAFMGEKQVEAIELVKLATGSADATKTQYKVTKVDDRSEGLKQVTVTSTGENLEYASGAGAWVNTASKSLNTSYIVKDGVIAMLMANGANWQSAATSPDTENVFVKLTENTYSLTITPVADNAAAVQVSVKVDGAFEGAKGAQVSPYKITVELQMTVDKESLATSAVKILKSKALMTYPNPKGGSPYSATLDGEGLTVNADGLCSSLSGNTNGLAGKKPLKVTFAGEQITVGDKWSQALATCGKRPTVDLGRLQVY